MNRTRTRRRRRARAAAVLATAVLAVSACGADEQQTAEAPVFSNGEEIRIILGSSPGGGFDTHTRLLQPYFESAIEAETGTDVRVVVQNMTGADHRVATEHVFNSPPDGTRMIFSSAALMATNEVFRDAKTTLTDMTGLAGAGRSVRGIVVRTDVDPPWPGDTLADVLEYSTNHDVLISHPGLDVDLKVMELLLQEAGLEVGWKPIAIGQTAEDVAALLRGEIEVAYADLGGMGEALADNPDQLRAVAALGCERAEEVPDVPTIVEQGLPNAEELCNTIIAGHPLVILGPPDMPADVTTVLRNAFESSLTDKEYVQRVTDARQPHDWVNGQDTEAVVKDMVSLFKQYQDEIDIE